MKIKYFIFLANFNLLSLETDQFNDNNIDTHYVELHQNEGVSKKEITIQYYPANKDLLCYYLCCCCIFKCVPKKEMHTYKITLPEKLKISDLQEAIKQLLIQNKIYNSLNGYLEFKANGHAIDSPQLDATTDISNLSCITVQQIPVID